VLLAGTLNGKVKVFGYDLHELVTLDTHRRPFLQVMMMMMMMMMMTMIVLIIMMIAATAAARRLYAPPSNRMGGRA
jgi:threonine/homoserine/homoserine lactone efflux protein